MVVVVVVVAVVVTVVMVWWWGWWQWRIEGSKKFMKKLNEERIKGSKYEISAQ